jgi:carboxyl-terminal processing protease
MELEDGSGLKLTVARYYTPRHRSIQELGITPDVAVAEVAPPARAEERPAERDLERHLRNAAPVQVVANAPAPAPDDHQLKTAVDYLKALDIFKTSTTEPRGRSGVTTKRE